MPAYNAESTLEATLSEIPEGSVDEIILVDNDEICAAVQDIFEDTRAIVELFRELVARAHLECRPVDVDVVDVDAQRLATGQHIANVAVLEGQQHALEHVAHLLRLDLEIDLLQDRG